MEERQKKHGNKNSIIIITIIIKEKKGKVKLYSYGATINIRAQYSK